MVTKVGVNKDVQREYGYASQRGNRCVIQKGARARWTMHGKHITIEQYEHTTTVAFFKHWSSERMVAVIIMDNASFHRKSTLLEFIEERGWRIKLLFLPTSSPDFNPIEKSWANKKRFIKHYLYIFRIYATPFRTSLNLSGYKSESISSQLN